MEVKGIVNRFLSLPIFQVMSRFTYSMFLNHVTLLLYMGINVEEPIEFSIFYVLFTFWGVIAFSFGISIIMVLAFESPVVALEKYILPAMSHRPKTNNKDYNDVTLKQEVNSKVVQFEQA
ncbi:unnamed protein product [Ceutorhynchus assimilis]|uniref:Acyltransferase n=1 Tax=Ceutorhynchus assimilis TaxID=467358 RepID=A0A9N9QPL1_9CUCU|nr:unnamed protein product [Ceutorhynchus assimilis]